MTGTLTTIKSRGILSLSHLNLNYREARKKQKMLKEIEDKKTVRAYEEQKSKGTVKFMSGPGAIGGDALDRDSSHSENHHLDDLWQSIRNFFDDVNSKGEKREFAKGEKSNKLKFMEACESFDFAGTGAISEANIMTAFSRSRFRPLMTQEQLSVLIAALEAYVSGDANGDVNFRKILEAPVSRETQSINSIFPKIVRNTLSLSSALCECRRQRVPVRSRLRTRRRRMRKKTEGKRRLRRI